MKYLYCLCLVGALSACETVQPWERGTLARNEMQWQPDILEANLRKQIHASREDMSGASPWFVGLGLDGDPAVVMSGAPTSATPPAKIGACSAAMNHRPR